MQKHVKNMKQCWQLFNLCLVVCGVSVVGASISLYSDNEDLADILMIAFQIFGLLGLYFLLLRSNYALNILVNEQLKKKPEEGDE